MLLPLVFAFLLTVILLPLYIKWLKRLQLGQFIREEGPQSHAVKAKTPTAGGVIFVIAIMLTWFVFSALSKTWNMVSLMVIFLSSLCALLGLSDDTAKFTNKANRGLSAKERLIWESIFGVGFAFVLLTLLPHVRQIILSTHVAAHIAGHYPTYVLPAIVFVFLSVFLVAATTNAINLHDGMDGLASGTLFSVFLTLSFMLLKIGNPSLALLSLACAGTLAGFLLFNCYPAKIFMGDVGSLFLGGILAAIVLSSGLILWFIPLSLLYILETLSVMLQVSYFKLTKPYVPEIPMSKPKLAIYKLTHRLPGEGKRIFRMAPLHHHFEAVWAEKGIGEWQAVLAFWLVQLVICAIVVAAFFSF